MIKKIGEFVLNTINVISNWYIPIIICFLCSFVAMKLHNHNDYVRLKLLIVVCFIALPYLFELWAKRLREIGK